MNPDDQSKLDNSWMIEEYKALRAEILANEDYQKNLLIYGSLVLATAFGFIFRDSALQPHRCILLFLTQILAVGFWHTFERLALSTEEIGTYIDCYLEKYTALNWEIFQRVTKDTSTSNDVTKYPKKSFYRQFINACSQLPFVIFSIVCCVLIVKETYANQTSVNFSIAAFSVVLLLFMVGTIVYYEYTLKSALKLVDETENRLEASKHYRSTNKLHVTTVAAVASNTANAEQSVRRGAADNANSNG